MSIRFSVIIPSYNGGEYLKLAVTSVLQQSHTNFELIILDDCSTDDSLKWLHQLNDSRIKLYTTPHNLGIAKNWRRSLTISKGEFMTFFGQDDIMDPNYLKVMDELIQREPAASLYFAHFRFIDHNGELLRHCHPLPGRETAAEYITNLFSGKRDTWGTGYIMRSIHYDEVGGIPEYKNLLFADDALWIQMMHKSWKATASQECFACRRHNVSTGASSGLSWIEGMEAYITFLEELSREDRAIAEAYKNYSPHYFYTLCRDIYIQALNKATRNNLRFEKQFQKEIFAQLKRVSPTSVQQLAHDKRIVFYRILNANFFTRWLCHIYLARLGR